MTISGLKRGLAIGLATAALTLLPACDLIESRKRNFDELSDQVKKQISHDVLGEASQEDRLAAASVESRALSGRLEPAPEIADVTIDEALRTESYFAVGSIIAKPRVQMAAIIASADLAEQVEVGLEMEAPVAEAIEAPAPAASSEGARAPTIARRQLKVLPRRESMMAPVVKELDDAVARKLPEAGDVPRIRDLRQIQHLPDSAIQRIESLPKAPGPRIRKVLMEDEAKAAKDRVQDRLSRMGLPSDIVASDGGMMRIQVNAGPTAFPAGETARLDGLKARFAPVSLDGSVDCNSPSVQARFSRDAALATDCVVEVLEESGEYEYVEKDYIFSHQFERRSRDLPVSPPTTDTRISPNDPLWSLQWHFKDQGVGEDKSEGGASFADFWTRTRQTGSAGVVVAVVDTGLQMEHPDIKVSTNLAPGYDMVSDPFMGNDGDGRDSDPADPGDACDPSDPRARDTFHGTHVAGTVGVAATNNADGVAGGAWNVTIVPVRALGRCGGQLSDINDAIRWSAGVVPARDDLGAEIWNANPADIINLSIGLFERCPASMQEAINDATAAGAIVVAAAGNARIDTQYYAPGGCNNVITVAAGDARGQLAYYSNYGDAVDVLAPGGDMTRDDDGDGRPDGILSTKLSHDCYDPVTKQEVADCYYAYENGTSMAAPHVAAALALLKSQYPTATSTELRARLLTATSPRDQLQCSGKCTHYPGSTPIPGSEGLCYRPCGGAILNLSNASLE